MHPAYESQAVARWRKAAWGLLLVPMALANGCSSMNNTEAGVVGGGIAGGVVGTLIGAATGHPGAGAAIGAGTGAAIGGLSGAAADQRDRRQVRDVTAALQRGQQELEEVGKLARSGASDAVIIDHVRQSGALFNLSGDQIVWLQQNNVSQTVIHEIQMTSYYRPGGRVYMAEPGPVVIVEQPPPVGIGVGIGFRR